MSGPRTALLAACLTLAAACGSGESIITAGNDGPAATQPTSSQTTLAPPATSPGPTQPGDTVVQPPTTPPPTNATTTTVPLDALPACAVDALDGADEVVEITFWHGLNADNLTALDRATEAYNNAQSRVRVRSENQGGYLETIDKYFQSSVSDRPALVMIPDYSVQRAIDSDTAVPIEACTSAAGYDESVFQPSTVTAYSSAGIQWGMPFNVSNPILYYNKNMFAAAGLDPERPPQTLDELRQFSQQIVDSGAAGYGIALDSGSDSGGGWVVEQWFANMGELYADNGNGRLAPSTEVLYDGPAGVALLTQVQQMIDGGLAYYVGDNAGGSDQLFKMADPAEPAAMAIGTSAGLGTVLNLLAQGFVPGLGADELGIGPLPGPGPTATALVGGAGIFLSDGKSDLEQAAAWDFLQYLVSPEVQATFAADTGYVPVRDDALQSEPLLSLYRDDPRFRVAYDQLVTSPDTPALQGAMLGPQREIRSITAQAVAAIFTGADVQSALSDAAARADQLLADYNASN